MVSWSSKKKPTIAFSSAEAEYIATYATCTQAIWLTCLFEYLGMDIDLPISMHYYNLSMIAMTKNPVFHIRKKHIDIHHHFMRDLVEDGFIQFYHCPVDAQITDIFTKPFPKDHFFYLRIQLGVQTLDI